MKTSEIAVLNITMTSKRTGRSISREVMFASRELAAEYVRRKMIDESGEVFTFTYELNFAEMVKELGAW